MIQEVQSLTNMIVQLFIIFVIKRGYMYDTMDTDSIHLFLPTFDWQASKEGNKFIQHTVNPVEYSI